MVPTGSRPSPLRTCVGCRGRALRSELLRVVAVEGALVPDPARRLPGRGAHLHRDPACLALAERRRAWPRALHVTGPLDAAGVAVHLSEQEQRSAGAPGAGTTHQ